MPDWSALPGAEIVEKGLADLTNGRRTEAGLLVAIGAPKLRSLGLDVPDGPPDAEHLLYDLLSQHDPDAAHSRYNALIRRLVSFERALACAIE